ncbi:MAG: ABC transporter ATP-binding protein [Acidobacteria bacterium]|nr:ABC transporter ATP-binding protein [Acidobacteriota bacterium]
MPLIQIESVFVAYGNPPRAVLAGIDLEIEEGSFVCLLGQTGCGKSTLLRLVLGSERPLRGRILIDGREHHQPDSTRGYVPQRYALFPDRTVLDNITFGPEVSEFGLAGRLRPAFYRRRKELRDEAFHYLRRIGLRESDASKYPHQLSGGMQQRVAIAQALINRPRILLMDEAFSALDSGTRREMQSLVRELWKSTGTTLLFVTHNIDEALRLGTRVVVLAREAPELGSRIAMDLAVPDPCAQEDIPSLMDRLERVSCPAEAGGTVTLSV